MSINIFRKALSRTSLMNVRFGEATVADNINVRALLPALMYQSDCIALLICGSRLWQDAVYVADDRVDCGISFVEKKGPFVAKDVDLLASYRKADTEPVSPSLQIGICKQAIEYCIRPSEDGETAVFVSPIKVSLEALEKGRVIGIEDTSQMEMRFFVQHCETNAAAIRTLARQLQPQISAVLAP